MKKQKNNNLKNLLIFLGMIFLITIIIITFLTFSTEVCGNGYCRKSETCLACPSDCGECPYEYKFVKDFKIVISHSIYQGYYWKECEQEMQKGGYEKTRCTWLDSTSLCFGNPICDSYEVSCRCEY